MFGFKENERNEKKTEKMKGKKKNKNKLFLLVIWKETKKEI